MDVEVSEGVTYKINPAVLAISAAGWIIPSSLPAGIPLTGGSGLSQAFFASISANLASWPAGPSAQDPFWTLCFLWHIGMFACAMFGFIGYGMQNDQKA
jgi:photosystem I subunit PsaO